MQIYALAFISASACGMDDEPCDEPPYTIVGSLVRTETATIAPGRDGRGTAYVIALSDCRLDAAVVGAAVVPDADFAEVGGEAQFRVFDVPDGRYYLAAFLDDEADADPMGPRPGPGDLVHAPNGAGNGVLDCVIADVSGADAQGIVVPLDTTVPDL